MYKLGIDIGGTNIDFALVNEKNQLLYGYKMLANGELDACLLQGIGNVCQQSAIPLAEIQTIHLGTTLALNSLLELKSLNKVGLIRLAGHFPDLPPAYFWPTLHRQTILAGVRTIAGGREYNNASIQSLDCDELLFSVRELIAEGADSLAIISVFSPLYIDEENQAGAWIRAEYDLPITLSHELGTIGFIQRENATLLNAALKKVMSQNFNALSTKLKILGFKGRCFITQNNGTIVDLTDAIDFPIKTISSGPTNSLTGACKLANYQHAVIIDIGGTSTDIGVVENGFPFYSLKGSLIAGIPCYLVAPDIISLSIGGGSIIRHINKTYTIGPDSLGARLFEHCQTHGGSQLTLYDIGQRLQQGGDQQAENILSLFLTQISQTLETCLPDLAEKPILLVGGGAANIPEIYFPPQFERPPHFAIANAYGAALSEVSGQVDCIVQEEEELELQLSELEEKAKHLAEKKGAKVNLIRIIEKKVLPLYYMQKPMYRVRITAAGQFND